MEKDKWTNGETLLLSIDFETGAVMVNDKTTVATSQILLYQKLGATPFDIRFSLADNGDLLMDVHSVNGEEQIVVSAANLKNILNLTDTKNCYLSICPWDSRTTGSMDIVAIHGGEDACAQHEVEKPGGSVTQLGEENEGGCGSSMAAAGVCAAALAGAVLYTKKKKDEE